MTFLNGKNVEERIRTMEVSSHVSPVAALDFVLKALVQQQQEMGKEKGIVMDGRTDKWQLYFSTDDSMDGREVLDLVRNETLTCYNGIPGDGCGHCPACKLRLLPVFLPVEGFLPMPEVL